MIIQPLFYIIASTDIRIHFYFTYEVGRDNPYALTYTSFWVHYKMRSQQCHVSPDQQPADAQTFNTHLGPKLERS